MTTETIGGTCPCCSFKKMLQRHDTGQGVFMYDACPNCGFAYGTNHFDEPISHKDFWEHMKPTFKQWFDLKTGDREEVLDWVLTQERDDLFEPTIFEYTDQDIIAFQHENKILKYETQ